MSAIAVLTVFGAGLLRWLRRRYVIITVRGESMSPTYHSGDRLLVRRAPAHAVRRGDCVVFTSAMGAKVSDNPDHWLVKRAVAVQGDPVPRADIPALSTSRARVIPPGHLVVLGDNTAQSVDSRHFGFITPDRLLGRVLRRI